MIIKNFNSVKDSTNSNHTSNNGFLFLFSTMSYRRSIMEQINVTLISSLQRSTHKHISERPGDRVSTSLGQVTEVPEFFISLYTESIL